MTPAILNSVDDVIAATVLRASLVEHGLPPAVARAISRSVVAERSTIGRWTMLLGWVPPLRAAIMVRQMGVRS